MEIYIGIILPNQQVQFTVSVVRGIDASFLKFSQENVENYTMNNEICSITFTHNVKIMFIHNSDKI